MTTLVTPPGEGKAVSLGGFGAVFKIFGDSNEGRFSIVEQPIDPGRMVHPHMHSARTNSHTSLRARSAPGSATKCFKPRPAAMYPSRGAYHTRSGTRPRSLPDCSNSSRPQALKSISPNWPTCCGQAGVSTRLPI
jgi:hypothetical protein